MKKPVMLIIGCLFFHYNMAQEQEVMSEAQRLEISQEEYNDMVNHSSVKGLLPVTNNRLILESGEIEPNKSTISNKVSGVQKPYDPNITKSKPLKRGSVDFDLFKEVIIPEDTNNNNK